MKKILVSALCALCFVAQPAIAANVTGIVSQISTQGSGSQTVWVTTKIGSSIVYYVGTNAGVVSILSDAMYQNKPVTVYGGGAHDFYTINFNK